ncbi:MAG TPA: hypothetical protein VGB87_10535 [Vicinamibacteria bacterium]
MFRVFGQPSLVCPRCAGEDGLYPGHGPFASLGEWVGLDRYICTRCRRSFWHRAVPRREHEWHVAGGAAGPDRPDHDEVPAEADSPDRALAALAALDTAPGAEAPAPPDLAALDQELARLRGRRKRR